jgi:hypothetical protein
MQIAHVDKTTSCIDQDNLEDVRLNQRVYLVVDPGTITISRATVQQLDGALCHNLQGCVALGKQICNHYTPAVSNGGA